MSAGHDGREIANFILDFCDAQGRVVTNLALQKLVFFCHVWSLIEKNRPLVRHSFEAWEFGPVLPYLYRDFRSFDKSPINCRSQKIDPLSGKKQIVSYRFERETHNLLVKIVDFYSRLNAGQLVDLSHAAGGPWHQAWNHGGRVNPGMKISDDRIIEFYSRAIRPFSVQ